MIRITKTYINSEIQDLRRKLASAKVRGDEKLAQEIAATLALYLDTKNYLG